ncbi:MAG: NADH-quinone oxidoreductase subunit L [Candidatus Sumerlaeia bacterium]|nr:NADH-quinone oxidoreductase subunit L [Candidatus Sumerlaeia bacterium]
MALLVILIPAGTLVVHILLGLKLPRKGDWLATASVFASLGIATYLFIRMLISGAQYYLQYDLPWLNLGETVLSVGILVDNLTIVMLLVVTLVSALVHLYSIGYMQGDVRYCRYYTYLLLFTTSMLGLVLSNNLVNLYMCWELVGLSSYFLIGHWFEKRSAYNAAIKAFIVTRIGDVGMLLAILLIFFKTGALGYEDLFQVVAIGKLSGLALTLAGLGIFFGAMGKSAQFPLHVWLPDAMEGPTPISALIHAATMVAAGVYLVGRLHPIFTPEVLLIIAYIGGFTAFFSATIALVQNDIKRVLAYSTVSQLGYMMLGLGVGSFVAGMFHLTTHATFKALLFLGAGSVIHALHTNYMTEMGGLAKKMPITTITFLIATLAIAGFPGLSGFYSKDMIISAVLEFVFEHPQHIVLFLLAGVTAGLTAFYMFRLFFKTFTGKPRDIERYHHAHESPPVMTIPLIILAILAIVAGYGHWFEKTAMPPTLERYTINAEINQEKELTLGHYVSSHNHTLKHTAETITLITTLSISSLGILLAYLMFVKRSINTQQIVERFNFVYRLLLNKYYIDELYQLIFVASLHRLYKVARAIDVYVIDRVVDFSGLATRFSAWVIGRFDLLGIDGAVNGIAGLTGFAGNVLSFLQTGKIRNYVLSLVISIASLTILIFLLWK